MHANTPLSAFIVSATLMPTGVGCCCWGLLFGSNRYAGGGGKFSTLLTGVNGLLVLVIDAVRLIGGGGLFAWIELRRSKVDDPLSVPQPYTAKKLRHS